MWSTCHPGPLQEVRNEKCLEFDSNFRPSIWVHPKVDPSSLDLECQCGDDDMSFCDDELMGLLNLSSDSNIKKSKASFKFKMDNVTQRKIDEKFYSGTKYIQSLPWKVNLEPNIYGGEGKDVYFR